MQDLYTNIKMIYSGRKPLSFFLPDQVNVIHQFGKIASIRYHRIVCSSSLATAKATVEELFPDFRKV